MHRADFGGAQGLSRASMEVLATPSAARALRRKRTAVFPRRAQQWCYTGAGFHDPQQGQQQRTRSGPDPRK